LDDQWIIEGGEVGRSDEETGICFFFSLGQRIKIIHALYSNVLCEQTPVYYSMNRNPPSLPYKIHQKKN
jgi:hypothetical protein